MATLQEDYSDKSEAAAHRDLATLICKLHFDAATPVVAERNTLSIVTPDAYFAQRLDCRTYFAERQRYGHDRPDGTFQGPDNDQLAYCGELCERLGVSRDEVARADVLREFAQAAQIDPEFE